jgi:hypothetical protein
VKVGDLVSFSGSYLIEAHEGKKFCMSAIDREGIVCEMTNNFISVFSEGENCLIALDAHIRGKMDDYILIEVLSE